MLEDDEEDAGLVAEEEQPPVPNPTVDIKEVAQGSYEYCKRMSLRTNAYSSADRLERLG